MAALQCEICGGKLMAKSGGLFECEYCGMQYDKTRIQEMVQEIKGTVKVEGTVQVAGTVKVDGPVKVEGGINAESLMKRGWMALEDGNWTEATRTFDQALDMAPESAQAYLGKLMADLQVKTQEDLKEQAEPFDHKSDFQKALRFGDTAIVEYLNGVISHIRQRNEKTAAERAAASKQKNDELKPVRDRINPVQHRIDAGGANCLAVNTKGEVLAISDQDQYARWKDVVAVSAELDHAVGLRSNGTVVAWGTDYFGCCNVSGWKNIVAVSVGKFHTVGLKSDGTVVATKYKGDHYHGQCDVSGWTDIVAVSAGSDHTVGLKSDGTVVAVGNNQHGKCVVSGWTDIVAISAGSTETVGLKADGTTVTTSSYDETSSWTDIVAIDARSFSVVGLKADGTVVHSDKYSGWDVSDWTDIVAVSAGISHVVGLRSDGTVVAAGKIRDSKIPGKIFNWQLFNSVDTVEQERREEIERRKEEARRNAEHEAKRAEEEARRKKEQEEKENQIAAWRESGRCQYCGGGLKGFFGKKCVVCGKPKDY